MTSEDYDDTAAALAIVTEAAEHANETIKQMEKFQVKYYTVSDDQECNNDYLLQSMLSLQSRLGDYQVIMPGRSLVKEGELLKISRKVDI